MSSSNEPKAPPVKPDGQDAAPASTPPPAAPDADQGAGGDPLIEGP